MCQFLPKNACLFIFGAATATPCTPVCAPMPPDSPTTFPKALKNANFIWNNPRLINN